MEKSEDDRALVVKQMEKNKDSWKALVGTPRDTGITCSCGGEYETYGMRTILFVCNKCHKRQNLVSLLFPLAPLPEGAKQIFDTDPNDFQLIHDLDEDS